MRIGEIMARQIMGPDFIEPDKKEDIWQHKFMQQHDRWPTWADAMAHCSPEVKAGMIDLLKKHGVEVEEQ